MKTFSLKPIARFSWRIPRFAFCLGAMITLGALQAPAADSTSEKEDPFLKTSDSQQDRPAMREPRPKSRGDMQNAAHQQERLKVIEQFIDMPPEKLAVIRQTLQRLEQMTPEEREEMKQRLKRFKELPPENRKRLVKDFKKVPLAERSAIRRYWESIGPEAAMAEKRKMRSMTREERKNYRRELLEKAAKLPPPSEAEESRSRFRPRGENFGRPFPKRRNMHQEEAIQAESSEDSQ